MESADEKSECVIAATAVVKRCGYRQFRETLQDVVQEKGTKMELSRKERLVLANYYLVHEKLYPESKETYARLRKALDDAYELHFNELVDRVSEGALSEQECRELFDILKMWRSLVTAYHHLGSEDKDAIEGPIEFMGFDGEDEARLLSYVRYIIRECGLFTELDSGGDLDSGMPMLEWYRNMLGEWQGCSEKEFLSREDIVRIMSAG
jgi:hypothetical protein